MAIKDEIVELLRGLEEKADKRAQQSVNGKNPDWDGDYASELFEGATLSAKDNFRAAISNLGIRVVGTVLDRLKNFSPKERDRTFEALAPLLLKHMSESVDLEWEASDGIREEELKQMMRTWFTIMSQGAAPSQLEASLARVAALEEIELQYKDVITIDRNKKVAEAISEFYQAEGLVSAARQTGIMQIGLPASNPVEALLASPKDDLEEDDPNTVNGEYEEKK